MCSPANFSPKMAYVSRLLALLVAVLLIDSMLAILSAADGFKGDEPHGLIGEYRPLAKRKKQKTP